MHSFPPNYLNRFASWLQSNYRPDDIRKAVGAADLLGDLTRFADDPFRLAAILWPQYDFYDRQREIIRSVWDNDLTVVPSAHMLGKGFLAGASVVLFFLTRRPCRIVTTSVDGPQLEGVLWGEIRRFIQSSAVPLTSDRGGPLVVNHLHLKKIHKGQVCGISYCIGRVAARGEGMSGHHVAQTGDGVPRTLFLCDESSGVDPETMAKASEWANRRLLLGNPYDCDNEFRWSVEGKPGTDDQGGDVRREAGVGFRRRVIELPAEASPNVRRALEQQAAGIAPTGEIVVPGVLPWHEYLERLRTWDPVKQCVGLRAKWYKGADALLFPAPWLDHANALAARLLGRPRQAKGIGVDPGEGSADTSLAAVDELGVIEIDSQKTPDTDVIPSLVTGFMSRHGVPPERTIIDRGGGGKQLADRLRGMGFPVRTLAFGGAVGGGESGRRKKGRAARRQAEQEKEKRAAFLNVRALIYWQLRELLDPRGERGGFAIPARYVKLRRQLAPIPLTRDGEGVFYVLPKNNKDPKSKRPTLTQLLGMSPDEADAVVMGCHAMLHPEKRAVAGAMRWGGDS